MSKNFLLSPITALESYLEGHVINLNLFTINCIGSELHFVCQSDQFSRSDVDNKELLFSSIVRPASEKQNSNVREKLSAVR